MMPLAQKIEQLKARYAHEPTLPPYEVLSIAEILLSMLDQARADIGVVMEAQVRLDQRLNSMESVVQQMGPPYIADARGK